MNGSFGLKMMSAPKGSQLKKMIQIDDDPARLLGLLCFITY